MVQDESATCTSRRICSWNSLEVPYGLVVPPVGVSSVIGSSFGVPYTVAEDEKMIFLTLCFFITLSSTSVEYRLLS